jgi:hypothetical protein
VIKPDAPKGLVLPRPNLGPESWYEIRPFSGVQIVLLSIAGALLVGCILWLMLRPRRIRLRRGQRATQVAADATPRERLVALSNSIRDSLVTQFGIAWRAKTTEELSADGQLIQAIGPERVEELIRFLDQVDRIKFAPERPVRHRDSLLSDLEVWEPKVADFQALIRAKPDVRRSRQLASAGSSNLPLTAKTVRKGVEFSNGQRFS